MDKPISISSTAHFLLSLNLPLQFVALQPDNAHLIVEHAGNEKSLVLAVQQMQKLNNKGYNIYYEVNLGAMGRRSRGSDILGLRAVVGDADAKDGRSVEDCIAASDALPLPPTFTVATGGGVQVVYLLDEVTPVTADSIARYEKVGRALRDFINGDAVFDLPRIMRLPGFTNWPSPKKREGGREPVRAIVHRVSGRRYPLAELVQAFTSEQASAASTSPLSEAISGGFATGHWFEALPPKDKDTCLAAMLNVSSVAALADTSDGDPAPNWRTVLAACARSDAPGAYNLCRAWAQASNRFNPNDFDARWRSYSNG